MPVLISTECGVKEFTPNNLIKVENTDKQTEASMRYVTVEEIVHKLLDHFSGKNKIKRLKFVIDEKVILNKFKKDFNKMVIVNV